MRTGDLGFLKDGELFVTGRRKDLIIIRSQNYYPQDIELTVEKNHPALQANGGAAFSVERKGEQLVIVQEVQRTWLRRLNTQEVFAAIREAVSEHYELAVQAILLLKPGRLPKTSSGKIQRRACRERFLAGNLEGVGEWQRPKAKEITLSDKTTIEEWLIDKIAGLAGISPEKINTRHTFAYYGLDSANAVGLSGELSEWLGQSIPAAVAYEHPTIEALARYLTGSRASGSDMGERDADDAMENENPDAADKTPAFFTPDFGSGK